MRRNIFRPDDTRTSYTCIRWCRAFHAGAQALQSRRMRRRQALCRQQHTTPETMHMLLVCRHAKCLTGQGHRPSYSWRTSCEASSSPYSPELMLLNWSLQQHQSTTLLNNNSSAMISQASTGVQSITQERRLDCAPDACLFSMRGEEPLSHALAST